MMSESEYNNLMENLYVRSNPEYYNELIESINQLKKGKGKILHKKHVQNDRE